MKNTTEKICSICYQPYKEYGNNAWPINDGKCCDDCNLRMVIPARIARIEETEGQPPERNQ